MENIGASKIIERYKALSTSAISDALDRLGIKGGCEGIKSLFYGIRAVFCSDLKLPMVTKEGLNLQWR